MTVTATCKIAKRVFQCILKIYVCEQTCHLMSACFLLAGENTITEK